ncbi:c-type cytochrome [Ideonella paludis]|uniref:C-type cytochrome n=1 Tax=Ideonella paludis TaxID=1233411 RepID=A0ABS5DYA3_9BURK|nr:c-type cytochrome [Ideonella paludis]MBQ0936127.1 c-type cytochrome [Ideonella paludis]
MQPLLRQQRRILSLGSLMLLVATGPLLAQETNTLRGQSGAVASGLTLYNQHCAECHGLNATTPQAEAPDLRRMDGFCRRLKEPSLKADCTADVDRYFLRSVNEGKVRAGVVHMPPWKDVLTRDEVWAIRSFVETLPADPPRRITSVDAQRATQSAQGLRP